MTRNIIPDHVTYILAPDRRLRRDNGSGSRARAHLVGSGDATLPQTCEQVSVAAADGRQTSEIRYRLAGRHDLLGAAVLVEEVEQGDGLFCVGARADRHRSRRSPNVLTSTRPALKLFC